MAHHQLLHPFNKNHKSTTNLITQLQKNKVPPEIISSIKHLPQITPAELQKITFKPTSNCKSMNSLAKMQSLETLKLKLSLSKEAQMIGQCENELEEERKWDQIPIRRGRFFRECAKE